jgi:transposase
MRRLVGIGKTQSPPDIFGVSTLYRWIKEEEDGKLETSEETLKRGPPYRVSPSRIQWVADQIKNRQDKSGAPTEVEITSLLNSAY